MRARQSRYHALILGCLLTTNPILADDPSPKAAATKKDTSAPNESAPTKSDGPAAASKPPIAAIAPITEAEAADEWKATRSRIEALPGSEVKDKPNTKLLRELLTQRAALIVEWQEVHKKRLEAENPKSSPESEAAEFKAELEKTKALLDQSTKTPDTLLPDVFQSQQAEAKPSETRLGEMKEAIDAARNELKEQSVQLEALRADGTRGLALKITTLRAERDKAFQEVASQAARRAERQAALASATSADTRELAQERLADFDWSARVESERLAGIEVKIADATKRLDLATFPIAAKAARVQLAKRLAERMEQRYATLAERQRSDLKQAVAKEESRAAKSDDPLERRKAQRQAELFELESQVVSYEKTYATTSGASLQDLTAQADATNTNFAELRKLLDDGNVSPLDALRLKNDFRRIVPERAQVVQTDLAVTETEMTNYENALTDAEIDLVNDSRDDRFDRESLLEMLPLKRRGEAGAVLEDLETRHKALLNRRRNVLQKLAGRADDRHNQVLRRIGILDEQYAFIRTHIFWIRDAEPLGAATVAHARDDLIRAVKALGRLAMETTDRSLWGHFTAEFLIALAALVILPFPLFVGQRALDRLRIATAPVIALGMADYKPEGIEG